MESGGSCHIASESNNQPGTRSRTKHSWSFANFWIRIKGNKKEWKPNKWFILHNIDCKLAPSVSQTASFDSVPWFTPYMRSTEGTLASSASPCLPCHQTNRNFSTKRTIKRRGRGEPSTPIGEHENMKDEKRCDNLSLHCAPWIQFSREVVLIACATAALRYPPTEWNDKTN